MTLREPMSSDFISSNSYLASQVAAKYGFSKEVILSVMWQESTGNANASGGGLMQVSKGAFTDVQKEFGTDCILDTNTRISDLTYSDLSDARYNAWVGAAYLKNRAEASDGTVQTAITDYNGGGTDDYTESVMQNANRMTPGIVDSTTPVGAGSYVDAAAITPTSALKASPKAGSTSSNSSTSTASASNVNAIMDFAQFAQTNAFRALLSDSFTQSMQKSLHVYLEEFMKKFYHDLYYIPTLPDNFAIIVKPECCFIEAPACNVIYPTIKTDISYARDAKSEPTRIISVSNPVTNVFGGSGGAAVTQLITMAFMDEDAVTDANGNTTYTTKVQSIKALQASTGSSFYLTAPQTNLTNFEKRNGIRILRDARGDDLYLYLLSNKQTSTAKGVKHYIIPSQAEKATICGTLEALAKYTLLRARYEQRAGSCVTIANPYIVPGFPMLSIEGSSTSSLNIYAYVTNVTHSITDSSWQTTIGFKDVHIESEPRPSAFPIAEAEYTQTIENTYKNMLGAGMTKVNATTGAETCRTAYNNSDGTTDSMLKRIWRPLTTREQHLTQICDGATVVDEKKYTWFKNGTGKKFFDESVQKRIKEYTLGIMSGNAFTTEDVR